MLLTLFVVLGAVTIHGRATESERVEEWNHLYGQWPTDWMLERENPAYTKMFDDREVEINQLTGSDERWENWLQHTQARVMPTFTPLGFEVVSTPSEVHALLKEAIEKAVANWDSIRTERNIDVIYHPDGSEPKFIDIGSLSHKVHEMMLPYHEEWGGMKLIPTSAYGLRLYRNGSSLVMHVDKVRTHVISSIVHIAHEYDDENEPWPLDIEGHDGRLHSVILQPGQMAFYESSKVLHGRMQEFRGKYYGSIFLHYMPADPAVWPYTHEDIIQAVPPHWRDGLEEEYGARWSGASITVDSRVAAGAPPRHPNHRAQRMEERDASRRKQEL